MASEMAERFMNALQETERSGDPDILVQLFADDAELSNLVHEQPLKGREGATQFWREYLSSFDRIRSEFYNVIENDEHIVLEWRSEGNLQTGRPIHYRGVSILETRDETVHRFRSYYDSAAFLSEESADQS